MLSKERYLDEQMNPRTQFKRIVINMIKELKEFKDKHLHKLN